MTTSAVVDQIELGDHVCWFHDDEADGLDAVGRFAAAGLRLGHRVVCFVDVLSAADVRASAARHGVGPPPLAGELRIVSCGDSYLAGGRFRPERVVDALAAEIASAHREGHAGVRLVGDMAWAARGTVDLDTLRRYEAAAGALFLDGRAAGLCLYDRRAFSPEWRQAMMSAHPGAGPACGPRWTPLLRAHRTADPAGLRLVGQVDRSNRDAFAALLAAATEEAPARQPVVLDLSGLTFVDVRAATTLVRAGPRGVRLVGCRPALARLLDLVRGGLADEG
ncbi:MEDS domain-containing protein [Micromonospora sp. NPDC002575]|uniref:MEDS domain-containing protein n=1 Tax=Micromonospora sp. NPDC002575 TaxID=3364222 RepID=UPI00367B9B65